MIPMTVKPVAIAITIRAETRLTPRRTRTRLSKAQRARGFRRSHERIQWQTDPPEETRIPARLWGRFSNSGTTITVAAPVPKNSTTATKAAPRQLTTQSHRLVLWCAAVLQRRKSRIPRAIATTPTMVARARTIPATDRGTVGIPSRDKPITSRTIVSPAQGALNRLACCVCMSRSRSPCRIRHSDPEPRDRFQVSSARRQPRQRGTRSREDRRNNSRGET